MKKVIILIALVGMFFSSCKNNSVSPVEKFLIGRVDYEATLKKIKVFKDIYYDYNPRYEWAGSPAPGWLGAGSRKIIDGAEDKAREYEFKAEDIFISLCQSAVCKEHFDWLYQEINENPLRWNLPIVNAVFENENFSPNQAWLNLKKSPSLGKERLSDYR